MNDIAIIGTGPAGLSAAINGAVRNKKVTVFGNEKESSWLYKAEQVNNHLGMPNMTGAQMIDSFFKHAKQFDVEIKIGKVNQVLSLDTSFVINFENNAFESKALIIAIGMPKSVSVKGEEEFLGNGVSYCATCDGMLYRNKSVFVVGESHEGEEEANFLSEICSKVHYVFNYDEVINLKSNIIRIKGKVSEIYGDAFVNAIQVNEEKIPCDGVFFVKETIPIASLVPGLRMENNAIVVNRLQETNLTGVFAAGDCTGWPFQLSKAIGEGLVAAQQCVKFLK